MILPHFLFSTTIVRFAHSNTHTVKVRQQTNVNIYSSKYLNTEKCIYIIIVTINTHISYKALSAILADIPWCPFPFLWGVNPNDDDDCAVSDTHSDNWHQRG